MDAFLKNSQQLFQEYKLLGEKAMEQLLDEQLFTSPGPEDNSIAIIVKHLWGNMRSRWTDFLETDGEKDWRNRDTEFEADITDRDELMEKWETGWQILFNALNQLRETDLERTVYIRNEPHLVWQAIHRQMTHYAYHIGQLVYLAKWQKGADWSSLSIPRGQSDSFNQSFNADSL